GNSWCDQCPNSRWLSLVPAHVCRLLLRLPHWAALRLQDHFLNAANWMWLSATAFFNQYYRVYSPVTFGKKYDPEGKVIRRVVPQLARLPTKYIDEPWTAPLDVQQR